MKAVMSRVLVVAIILMMIMSVGTFTTNAQKSTVIYKFTFEDAGDSQGATILKKAGAEVGEIVEFGAAGNHALKYELNETTHTGAGVHPYIWPAGISGILAAQGELKWGDTIELRIDLACDSTEENVGFVYPFMLTNGENENYFSNNPSNPRLGGMLQTFTWELKYYEGGVVPLKGLDNGGIALVDEGSIIDGCNMYIDNVTLIKNGDWVEMDEGTTASYYNGTPSEEGINTTGEDDPIEYPEYSEMEFSEAADDEFGDHLVYSFTFDEEDAGTVFRKAGMTPGVIDTEVKAGDTGASLALPIAPNMTTGRGGVLPYIWPSSVSGIIAQQGALEEGEYYELRVDIAWDGRPVSAKKGQYVYPFMLINGTTECYMTGTDHSKQLQPYFQTFVYRLGPTNEHGETTFVTPQPGSDSGGIGFCSENSLACGYTLHFDNIKLIKHGNWKSCDTSSISYVNRAVAPTTYEATDENGVTESGRQTTLLYSNDFEGSKPESIFGHYNENIQSVLMTKIVNGVHDNFDYLPDNETNVDCYYIPSSSVPTNIFSDGAYPVIWLYNDSLKQVFKNEKPLGEGDYYVLQLDMYTQNSYAYVAIMVGDKEYSPVYSWTSENQSGSAKTEDNISEFGAGFVTRYYVFQQTGMDLSAGNAVIAFFTDGYINAFVPVYVDNFKLYSVRTPKADGMLGDADGDEEITMKDVLFMRKFIANLLPEGTSADESVMDVDGDGEVTMKDVLLVRKFVAGLITEFPDPAEATSDVVSEAALG